MSDKVYIAADSRSVSGISGSTEAVSLGTVLALTGSEWPATASVAASVAACTGCVWPSTLDPTVSDRSGGRARLPADRLFLPPMRGRQQGGARLLVLALLLGRDGSVVRATAIDVFSFNSESVSQVFHTITVVPKFWNKHKKRTRKNNNDHFFSLSLCVFADAGSMYLILKVYGRYEIQ